MVSIICVQNTETKEIDQNQIVEKCEIEKYKFVDFSLAIM